MGLGSQASSAAITNYYRSLAITNPVRIGFIVNIGFSSSNTHVTSPSAEGYYCKLNIHLLNVRPFAVPCGEESSDTKQQAGFYA